MAASQPHSPAIFQPSGFDKHGRRQYVHVTYAQLDADSTHIALGLSHFGIERGARVALMVKPSLEFFALVFGLYKAGVPPVIIDPGIGTKPLKTCLAEAAPEAFIGIPLAQAARALMGWAKASSKVNITVGSGWFGPKLDDVREAGKRALSQQNGSAQIAATRADELAAILFTSGSTGIPKGAVYSHGNFAAQVEMIRSAYDIQPGEIDLPTFPPFALFDPALGMTTVLPEMDFTKPASVNPERIEEALTGFGVTNMFGSPALLNTVSRWAEAEGKTFPSLRRVISAGAPVPAHVLARTRLMMHPDGEIHTPYGATESLPVASIESREVLGETAEKTENGAGVCVGRGVHPAEVRIIGITDDAITMWTDDLVVPTGTIGEITVASPTVTTGYFARQAQTQLAKLKESTPAGERVVHRMGDLGYQDSDGRIWFCGRKSHRVRTADGDLYTVPIEGVFNRHPQVFRTALVGVGETGQQQPVLCIERESQTTGSRLSDAELIAELKSLGEGNDRTRPVRFFAIHPGFPVDIRHNAKIGRPTLAKWATAQGAAR
ncbi:MAG: AMP-binding protein [Myxococcales bacterium]|nr:AMP-binding protein [Myxococcales bacterium]